MALYRRRIAYVTVWLLLLGFVLTRGEVEDSAKFLMLSVVEFAAIPISYIFMGTVALAISLLPDGVRSVLGVNILQFVNEDLSFKAQFFLWWLLMLSLSFWQWFYAFPKLKAVLRRLLHSRQQ